MNTALVCGVIPTQRHIITQQPQVAVHRCRHTFTWEENFLKTIQVLHCFCCYDSLEELISYSMAIQSSFSHCFIHRTLPAIECTVVRLACLSIVATAAFYYSCCCWCCNNYQLHKHNYTHTYCWYTELPYYCYPTLGSCVNCLVSYSLATIALV